MDNMVRVVQVQMERSKKKVFQGKFFFFFIFTLLQIKFIPSSLCYNIQSFKEIQAVIVKKLYHKITIYLKCIFFCVFDQIKLRENVQTQNIHCSLVFCQNNQFIYWMF